MGRAGVGNNGIAKVLTFGGVRLEVLVRGSSMWLQKILNVARSNRLTGAAVYASMLRAARQHKHGKSHS